MHERGDLERSFQGSLEDRTLRTTDALGRLVTDLPFESVEAEEVDAIRFVYAWPSFATAAAPISHRHGYWGWAQDLGILAPGERDVLDRDRVLRYLAALPEGDRPAIEDELSRLQTERFVAWFRACWEAVRGARPELRGFLSRHGSAWLVDLDSGERLHESACGVEAWASGS